MTLALRVKEFFVLSPFLRPILFTLGLVMALQAHAAGVRFDTLSPEAQTLLAPLQAQWDELNPEHQQRWLGLSKQYGQMPAERQQRIQKRISEWAKLSPEERQKARRNYQNAREQQPGNAARRQRWQEYQKLSPEEKTQWQQKNRDK